MVTTAENYYGRYSTINRIRGDCYDAPSNDDGFISLRKTSASRKTVELEFDLARRNNAHRFFAYFRLLFRRCDSQIRNASDVAGVRADSDVHALKRRTLFYAEISD